jgi:hypothetical protein
VRRKPLYWRVMISLRQATASIYLASFLLAGLLLRVRAR